MNTEGRKNQYLEMAQNICLIVDHEMQCMLYYTEELVRMKKSLSLIYKEGVETDKDAYHAYVKCLDVLNKIYEANEALNDAIETISHK